MITFLSSSTYDGSVDFKDDLRVVNFGDRKRLDSGINNEAVLAAAALLLAINDFHRFRQQRHFSCNTQKD